MSAQSSDIQNDFENIVTNYLAPDSIQSKELEVRFGTRGIKPITKIDFDNVIQKLLSVGFTCINPSGEYLLRIQNEYVDPKTGYTKISNIRAEINGFHPIQSYCKTNKLNIDMDAYSTIANTHFLRKNYIKFHNETQYPVNFDDFNFRVSLQQEEEIPNNNQIIRNTVSEWETTKKIFRYFNRVVFTHPDFPIKVDCSIVKSSKKNRRSYVPEYSVQEAGIFNAPEIYEIELEVDNIKIQSGIHTFTTEDLLLKIRKCIRYVLAGLQQTNYPISYPEQKEALNEYMRLIHGKKYEERCIFPKDFIGPASFTLQVMNITEINVDSNIPSVRNAYTVTDKADGERKLLYITRNGRVYLIDTNMNIQFTGAKTKKKEYFNTLLDGEHILHNKKGNYINLYAAFDIYFLNNTDVRHEHFVPLTEDVDVNRFRLPLLNKIIKKLDLISVVPDALTPIRVTAKTFNVANSIGEQSSIFSACEQILQKESDGLFEYETDGLIFTPTSLGVGVSKSHDVPRNFKITWDYSFKWKPSQFNTIDFLVTTQKDVNGEDFIGNIFQDGKDTNKLTQLTQYKTLVLRVGFDERKHGYINPCQNIIDNLLPEPRDIEDIETYKPVPFYPTNPYDPNASIANILIRMDGNGVEQMFTEGNEAFTDNTIVEFRYDLNREEKWRWIPIKIRYDKTAAYRRGLKNYGNAYHVANSNWHSIHNPLTPEMISTGKNIPTELDDDDIYYNRLSGSNYTRGLRDFHNLYVKRRLILSVSNRRDTLIDYAVGKGGDLPKWIAAKLSFVFGIDISRDNIDNRLDGACARFLNYRKKFRVMPYALFVIGNTSQNIRNKDALYTEKGKQITDAIFGEGPKDEKLLGKGVYMQYGKGKDGFNISSCQFAIHYFFENPRVLQGFLRNISECTAVGGYFIGTSYDGKLIFNALRDKKQGENMSIYYKENKIWEVKKEYDRDEFEDNESSLGYAINVYQESINKSFKEFLVNYDYFTRLMENYGFVLLTKDEAIILGLPASTGLFSDLYSLMEQELKERKLRKTDIGLADKMNPREKQISFFNRYFVFKKVRNVDADTLSLDLSDQSKVEQKIEESESKAAEQVSEQTQHVKKKPKKLSRKLKLKLVEKTPK